MKQQAFIFSLTVIAIIVFACLCTKLIFGF